MSIVVKYRDQSGFTIVELLVVIVVIGILAAITIVSYSGISQRAIVSSMQSDLSNGSTKLQSANVVNGQYPDSIDCSQPESATNACIKASGSNTFIYKKLGTGFALVSSNGSNCYSIALGASPEKNCIVIGSQVWQSSNMNVGSVLNLSVGSAQTDNSSLEKYCRLNSDTNCTNGGIYQWGEAMQYSNIEGSQGICPNGFHIPTNNEWKNLEVYLGMSQATADSSGWRGSDQGTKLKVGGSSGFNAALVGYTTAGNSGWFDSNYGTYWTSTQSDTNNAWRHSVHSTQNNIEMNTTLKTNGFLVRCII